MMWLVLASLLGTTSTAHAAGVGTSVGVFARSTGGFVPSLDLHFEPVLIQIHVGEFLRELSEEEVQLGANFYITAAEAGLPGSLTAVVQPGAGLDLFADPSVFRITGECRVGAQLASDRGGFGLYVVPAFGFALGEGAPDNQFIVGGAVQISAWLGS